MNHTDTDTDTDTGGAVYDTVEAIRSWPVNDSGWHVDPKTGRWIKLGDGVRLGDEVRLGNWVRLGDGVRLGNWVTLGNWVRLGDGVRLGNGVTIPATRIADYTANPYAPGIIRIGCEIHTVEEWRQNGGKVMADHGLDADMESAMMKQLEWLADWFDAYPEAMLKAREASDG